MIIKLHDTGENVAQLQRRLRSAGYQVELTHVFDQATQEAVMGLQRTAGLVVDGVAGPKTFVALAGGKTPGYLGDADLEQAAAALGVSVATIRAVNEVESRGQGMIPDDGRPVILFERHRFWQQLEQHGVDPAGAAEAWPQVCSRTRGGYQGGAAEYVRLATATLIHPAAALESCSWGAFQVMGYHWKALGYESIDAFVACMKSGEAAQLDAFVRYIAHDPVLLAALKARKWAAFAKGYNGPDYAANLYDAKLAQAYSKYSGTEKVAA